MTRTLTGTLHGNVIELDLEAAEGSPERQRLEGARVRIALEPLDDADLELSAAEQKRLWKHWVESGPQGPIEDEGEP